MDSDIGVVVLSAIQKPLEKCLRAIQNQEGGPYPIIYVENVFPMSEAFSRMLEVAQTKFVVQVDGDIVLKPWAIKTLLKGIRYKPWVYASWGQLYEDGFGLGGAVRCWRVPIVKQFGFRNVRCVDRDLHKRIRRWGFQRYEVKTGAVFGTHYPRETEFDIFSKTRNDVAKWIYLKRTDLLNELCNTMKEKDNLRFYAMGSALMLDINKSKDLSLDLKMYEALKNANRF